MSFGIFLVVFIIVGFLGILHRSHKVEEELAEEIAAERAAAAIMEIMTRKQEKNDRDH